MFTVKIDTGVEIENCPTFVFDTLAEAAEFTRLCFKNGFDVYMKSDEVISG